MKKRRRPRSDKRVKALERRVSALEEALRSWAKVINGITKYLGA